MPALEIATNATVSQTAGNAVITELSAALSALLGKDEQWVVVTLDPKPFMSKGGSTDPLALCSFSSV